MLLGFLELQQKWGHVEEGEACWFLWRHLCPRGLLAVAPPSFVLTEKESSLTWVAACVTPCRVPGTWDDWVSTNRAPERVCQVLWWWLRGDSQAQAVTLLLSPDESTLLSLRDPVCSVVFSALTDPSVQLQLVGIRALTVLGSLQGWCLVSLGGAEGSVILFWETLCLWLLGHPCPLSVGAQKQWQHFIPGPSVPGILSLSLACFCWASCVSGVWCPAALLLVWRRGKDGGQNSLWLRAGPLYGSSSRLPVSL